MLCVLYRYRTVLTAETKDNILVDGGPALTAVICDFGTSFSQAITGLATTDSAGRGSFPYLAPEIVLDGERPSQRTDVYAFAITLWEVRLFGLGMRGPKETTFLVLQR
jgi:serine/threonine protein kinase